MTKKNKPTALGKALTRYRKQRNLTMRQLASEIGVTESYISFIESGMRSPGRKLIQKLVTFFYPQGNPSLQDEWLMIAGFAPIHLIESRPATGRFQHFEDQLSQSPEDLSLLFAYIRAQIKAGNLSQAETIIQNAFQSIKDSVAIQSLLGTLELARGNYDNAILAQKTALTFYRESTARTQRLSETDLLLSQGIGYFLKGLHALEPLNQAKLQKKPFKKALAACQEAFGNARDIFTEALDLDPEDIYIWDEYARVLFNLADLATPKAAAKLWQEAIDAYQKVLKHPENGLIGTDALLEAALFLGYANTKQGDFDEGEKIFSLLQAIRPDYALAHYARACHLSLKAAVVKDHALLEEAQLYLNKALRLDSERMIADMAQSDPDLAFYRQHMDWPVEPT